MNAASQQPAAWCEHLFQAQAPGLILYGRALGLSHGEAEDVLQETFLALLKLAAPPDEPARYCLRAFRHRAFNYRRRLWRRLTREFESRAWFEPPTPANPAEAAAIRCLTALPPEQREVVVLKIWHQHTFQQIAELLDLSPHTVAGRFRYGIQRIRNSLNQQPHAAHEPADRLGESFAFLDSPESVPNT